jgi:hypothetical protein
MILENAYPAFFFQDREGLIKRPSCNESDIRSIFGREQAVPVLGQPALHKLIGIEIVRRFRNLDEPIGTHLNRLFIQAISHHDDRMTHLLKIHPQDHQNPIYPKPE